MPKNNFLLVKKLKNNESAQLCRTIRQHKTHRRPTAAGVAAAAPYEGTSSALPFFLYKLLQPAAQQHRLTLQG